MKPIDAAWKVLKAGPYAHRGSMTGIPEKLTQNRYRTLDAEGNLGFLGPQHNRMHPADVMPLLAQRGLNEGQLIDTVGMNIDVTGQTDLPTGRDDPSISGSAGTIHHFKDGHVLGTMDTSGLNDLTSDLAQSRLNMFDSPVPFGQYQINEGSMDRPDFQ